MWSERLRSAGKAARDIARNLVLITCGSVIAAVGVNGILAPHQFLSGGLTGIALGASYLFPSLPVAWSYALLNIPVFLLGWAYVSRRFFIYSIIGTLIFSATLEWVHIILPVQDKILAAILAGIIIGLGSGVTLRSQGSAGGTDIISVLLLNRFSIRIGSTVLVFNSVVLIASALVFTLDAALYTLMYLYVSNQMLDLVLNGLSRRRVVLIISTQWEAISREILNTMDRGVTLLHGEGGYTHQAEQVLFTVIALRELPHMKTIIRKIDPQAFVVVQDTLEVMGHRIGNQPHW